jgi:hypothetical protein
MNSILFAETYEDACVAISAYDLSPRYAAIVNDSYDEPDYSSSSEEETDDEEIRLATKRVVKKEAAERAALRYCAQVDESAQQAKRARDTVEQVPRQAKVAKVAAIPRRSPRLVAV